MQSIAQKPADSQASARFDDGRVGVYLHLPYCERVCPYCDFAVLPARVLSLETEKRYVEALERELEARRADFAGRPLASVYFGGGTPSLFRPESIARLLAAVRAAFPLRSGCAGMESAGDPRAEVDGPRGVDARAHARNDDECEAVETTLELNPGTTELARLPAFRAAGVDRLSIGVQSFRDAALKRLGRAHRAELARATLAAARSAGFANLSIDLIFALAEETEAELDRDLDELIAFAPEHVSTYELTFEPETPFGRALARGRMQACDEDRAAEMIERIEARLSLAGFERYEISSYARTGRRSRHNARYWRREAVLGIGLGAHSFDPRTPDDPHGLRRANPRALADWLAALARDPARAGHAERLTPETARGEAVFLGLRQCEGLSAERFRAEFGEPPRHFFEREIAIAGERGWIEVAPEASSGDLRLTAAGRLVADSVAALFVAPEAD